MRHTDLKRAARETIENLERFTNTLLTDTLPQEVDAAREALTRALNDYSAAVFNHTTSRLAALEETAEALEEDWANDDNDVSQTLPDGTRLSVRSRVDYIVTDPDQLIAAGRAAYAALWPDDRPEEVEGRVSSVISALEELLHKDGHRLLDSMPGHETYGLKSAGWVNHVCVVDRALQDYPEEEWPENPFHDQGSSGD